MNLKKVRILAIILFVIFSFTIFFESAYADFNKQINYQGKLRSAVDSTVVPDGNYNIDFDIYTVDSGGSPIWTETRTLTDRVAVKDGLFSVLLGEVTPLTNVDFTQNLYLAVTIGSTTTSPTWDTEMTPRKKFGAVPASMLSSQVMGEGRSSVGTTSPIENVSLTIEATSTNSIATVIRGFEGQIADLFRIISNTGSQLLTFTSGGNLGIGTSSPYAKLSVVGDVVTDRIFATSTTATSTFAWGLQANALNITSTTATSTFANGINLADGCFSVDGVCLGGGATDGTWSTTSATYWQSATNFFSTTSSDYWLTLNQSNSWSTTSADNYMNASTTVPTMYKANIWTALNIFDNASTSALTVSGNSYLGTTTITNLAVTNIGTSTVAGNLNVQGVLQVGTGSLYLTTNSINAGNGLFSINTNATTTFSTTTGFMIGTSTSAFTVQQGSGFVGIGTSTPTVGLTVASKDAMFNAGGSGALSTWQNTSAINVGGLKTRELHSSVVSNGYVYVIGGYNGTVYSTVYYAKLNSNGTVGTWQETNSINVGGDKPRFKHTSVAVNGYIYVIGGSDTTTPQSTVYYSKINTDGSLGAWQSTSEIGAGGAQARYSHTSVVSNGYIYILGGEGVGNVSTSTVEYAKVKSDGSLGTWQSTNSINVGGDKPREYHSSVVSNGYVYVIGGDNDVAPTNPQSTIYYAKINSDGTLGTWLATNSINVGGDQPRLAHTSIASNGYLYVIGGMSDTGLKSTVYYAKMNSDGTLGSWQSTNNIIMNRIYHSSVVSNGYVYLIGGDRTGSLATSTVYYSSLPRTTMASNLDLIGMSSTTLSDSASGGGAGGSIFAGDIYSNGALEVTGNTNLWNGLNVNGLFSLKATTSSSQNYSIFSIQNATNTSPILTTLYSGNVGIGTSSPYTALSVVGETVSSYFTANSTTATSTFANGLNLTSGCFSVGGTCIGGGGSGTVLTGTAGQFPFYASNGTTLTATSSIFLAQNGNIGIGTTNPASKLAVFGAKTNADSYNDGILQIYDTTSYAADVGGSIAFLGKGSSAGTYYAAANISAYKLNAIDGDYSFGLKFNTRNNNFAPATAMTINNIGNVGIGTTSPYAKLSVAGQVVASYYTATSTTATSTFANGIALSGGCFSVGGVCLGTGGTADGTWSTTSADNYMNASATVPTMYKANTWTALNIFGNASTSALTVTNNSYLGTTTISNLAVTNTNTSTFSGLINVSGTGTSTISSNLNVQGYLQVGTGSIYLTDSATSTFTYGLQAPALNITSTTATSTFANGINLTGGCFSVNGVCQTSSSGIYATTSNSGVLGTASFNSSGESVANLITSGNISDITKDPEPNWVVTFTNPEPNTNYNPVIKVSNEPGQPEGRIKNGTKTVNGFSFYITRADNGAFAYPTIVEVSILRYTPSIPLSASQNDVTGSRVLNTVYQNNTGKPLFVSVASRSNSGAGSSNAYSDSSVSPTKIVAAASGAEGFNRQITFVVIPGDYYKVTVDSASTVEQWIEWTLDGGGAIVNNSWSTTSADNYMNASATVPTMYKANTWTALNIFNNASTSALTVTNNSWLGTTTISNLAVTNTNTSTFGGLINVSGTGTSTISSNLNVQGTLQVGTGSLYLTGSGISSTDGSVSIGTTGTTTFGTNGFNVGTNALIIQQTSGNIGIGTTTINEKLTVDGGLSLAELAEVDIPGATIGFGKLYASMSTGFGGGIGGNDTFTKFLLPADGSDATFVDSSSVPKSITAYGDATQSATQSKFGGKSAYFDGTGDYLTTPNSDDFRFRTGDFSVDWWMYCGTDWTSMDSAGIVGQKETDPSSGWVIYKNNIIDPTSVNIRIDGTNDYSSNAQPTTATWEHWAVTRQSGTLRWFKNGTLTATHTVNADINDTSGLLMIGRSQVWSGHFNGYIDELRITKGIARWTSDFTPPASAYDTTSLADSTNLFFKSSLGGLVNLTAWKQNGTSTYYSLGNVSIGTSTLPVSTLSVQGSLCVRDTGSCGTTAGTIYATNASISDIDLAENYPVSDITLEAGDLVSLDTSTSTTIKKANGLNKETILGVISTKPGLTLGKEIINGKPVALAGRIPVKVNLENGPIQIGDRISISSIPGVGMKMSATSTQSVGIALESFDGKDLSEQTKFERIVVFVNLSWNKLDTSITEGNVNSSIWTIDETTGFIKSVTAQILDMQEHDIVNVRKIISANGKWSMDENGKLRVKELEADKVKTGEFCMDDICITKDKFKALLINAGIDSTTQNSSPSVSGTTSEQTPTITDESIDTEAPTITLNGNNPANIILNSMYSDMGAIITDNKDQNLGYSTSLWIADEKISDNIENIDTSKVVTYIIKYDAMDGAGNIANTTTRTLIVNPPTPIVIEEPTPETDFEPIIETSTTTDSII